jgi:hypothetical protein
MAQRAIFHVQRSLEDSAPSFPETLSLEGHRSASALFTIR